jgi:hypothetical protein
MTDLETTYGPLLAIDIGKVLTRVFLFDLVNNRYRLLGVGKATTSLGIYGRDIRHGVRMALEELQAITGRNLMNAQKEIIQPVSREGSGVAQTVVTTSAGPPLKVYLGALLKDVSLSSAERLAYQTYTGQVKSVCLDEGRKVEVVIDEILFFRPDLIIIAGGSNGGASRSVLRILEPIRLALLQLPDGNQPEILFVGNESIQPSVQIAFNHSPHLHLGPNIRPDIEHESFESVRPLLAHITGIIRTRQIPGLADLLSRSTGNSLPSVAGLSRVIGFLSQAHGPQKGVLGVDLGSSSTTMAAAFDGRISVGVFPGGRAEQIVFDQPLPHPISRWLMTPDISNDVITEFLLNKLIFPASVPLTGEDLDLQYAFARLALNNALEELAIEFPANKVDAGEGLLPWVEPILAAGSALTNAATPGQACLILLDGLQPTGITTLVLDPHQVIASLGAIAEINPALAVQLLDSEVFMHLATVISPIGRASPSTPILRVKMTHEDGYETTMDVKDGDLEVIPLPPGKTARLKLQPFHRFDIGMGGAGRGGSVNVLGSALGVVIDARGRPLRLPEGLEQRKEIYRKWVWMLGG